MPVAENVEIALLFEEIADLLELKGDNPFKIRAYRNAARSLKKLPLSVREMAEKGDLTAIPGVGKDLAQKIGEFLQSGRIAYLERLREEVPPVLREIMSLPGVGPKTAARLYEELGVRSLEDLARAAKEHRIKNLKGMGSKTEQNILRGLEMVRRGTGQRVPIALARLWGEELLAYLEGLPGVVQAALAGSARRWKETVGDLDIVCAVDKEEKTTKVVEAFLLYPAVQEVLARGENRARVVLKWGLQVDLLALPADEFATALHHFTGSKEHNVRLRGLAHSRGLRISEYGLFREDGKKLPVRTEEDLYRALGMPWIPPELREDRGEIEAALAGELPRLVEEGDIKGDLHVHSNWSDGVSSIEELVTAARRRGYSYLAITDHSRSLGVARGLKENQLWAQRDYVRRLNEELQAEGADFRVFWGLEVDILAKGGLDYEDEVLAEMDVVIASVHSGFRQDEETVTGRIIDAMKNPWVDIIAHPTGRLLGRRDPYAVNVDRLLEAAARYDKILEINASPDRLDLNDGHARQAKEMGIKIAINTDAHDTARLDDMRYGVAVARRAWLEPEDIINTMNGDDLWRFLCKRKGKS
ncbi:MAG: polymerase [Eubacteriales bacterium]|nr:polymerase [Eubacteriales bacterium]